MTRKHTHRKHYALVNPVSLAILGCAVTDTALLDRLRLMELSALESFKRGEPTIEDWRTAADILNVSETMAKNGIGPEALPACERAQEALQAGFVRFKEHGRIGRAAGEYEAFAELAAYYDLQRSSISRAEYERMLQKTRNRILGAPEAVKVTI